MCPDEIVDIYVGDYIKEDGTREYETLVFFSDRFLVEANEFIIQDKLMIVPIKNKIKIFRIEKKDYDFIKATEQSRLSCEFIRVGAERAFEFRAARENCDNLKNIILKYIKPNLAE